MNSNSGAGQNIPQDEFQELREFFRSYGKPVAAAACIILAVITALALYRIHTRTGIRQASLLLSSAQTLQDLETLVEQHPATPVAPLAVMKLAKVYFDSGNCDMALNKYVEFKLKFPEHQMAVAAELGRIHCMEAKGQLEDALMAFTAFSAKHPGHFLTPQAVFGQGRCLEQLGRYREAKALYEDFIAAHPESGWIPRTEELLASVTRKLEQAPGVPRSREGALGPSGAP